MADAYVVDTGVFLRWFVDQDGFEHAWLARKWEPQKSMGFEPTAVCAVGLRCCVLEGAG